MDSEKDFEKMYRMYYMEVYSYAMTVIKNSNQAEEICCFFSYAAYIPVETGSLWQRYPVYLGYLFFLPHMW